MADSEQPAPPPWELPPLGSLPRFNLSIPMPAGAKTPPAPSASKPDK